MDYRTSEVFMYQSITGELTGRVSGYLFKTSVIAYCLLKRWLSFHQSSL